MAEPVHEDTRHGLPVFRGGRFAFYHGGQNDDLIQGVFALGHLGQNVFGVDFLFKVVQHGGDDLIHVFVLGKIIGIRKEVPFQAVNPLGDGNVLQKFVVELVSLAGVDEFRAFAHTGLLQESAHLPNLNTFRKGDPNITGRFAHDVADLEKAAVSWNLVGARVPAVVPPLDLGHHPEQGAASDKALLLQLVGHNDGSVAGVHGNFVAGSAGRNAGHHQDDGSDNDDQCGNACDDDISLLSHSY